MNQWTLFVGFYLHSNFTFFSYLSAMITWVVNIYWVNGFFVSIFNGSWKHCISWWSRTALAWRHPLASGWQFRMERTDSVGSSIFQWFTYLYWQRGWTYQFGLCNLYSFCTSWEFRFQVAWVFTTVWAHKIIKVYHLWSKLHGLCTERHFKQSIVTRTVRSFFLPPKLLNGIRHCEQQSI